MTIIKSTVYLSSMPFLCLEKDLVDSLLSPKFRSDDFPASYKQTDIRVKLLEGYCHLHNHRIKTSEIATESVQDLLENFFRVLKGSSLVGSAYEYRRITFEVLKDNLINLHKKLHGTPLTWLTETDWHSLQPQDLEPSSLDAALILYWGGWPAETRKGKGIFLELHPLFLSHGRDFTLQYYSRWQAFIQKQASPYTTSIRKFAEFLSSHADQWPPSTFKSPIELRNCIRDFLKHFFLDAHSGGKDIPSAIKAWNRFVSNVDEVFIQPGVWPEPFGSGLPCVFNKKTAGAKTRISEDASGTEIHDKLITEVPLEYSDDQAIQIIFDQIGRDLYTVKRWSRSQALSLRKRQIRRKILANQGDRFAPCPVPPSKARKFDFIPEEVLPNLCAKFEHFGFFIHSPDQNIDTTYHWFRRQNLAYQLGLPTVNSLFPFMCFLIIEHPEITHSFLQELEIFNKHGQRTGFVKTDTGYLLTGYKDRRKKSLAEQKIFLKPRSSALVRQIIEITQPLRDFLKARGDDNWRKLFLTCGKSFYSPKAGLVRSFQRASQSDFNQLEREFSRYTTARGTALKNFLTRIKLSSIRASRGVEIYLETQSVERMAKALGHAKHSPRLLSHYLPESILGFFQTRWIRIFQKAFICEAMKDSPYLLKATNFNSMQELHEFLKNHAIKDIPGHLSSPDSAFEGENPPHNDQVLISIDKGILTALLSLNEAVERSQNKEKITGLARYWSNVSSLIENEISRGNDALLKQHLSVARKNIDPKMMEGLLYDTAA